MDIYTDYANWKIENYDLIKNLVQSKSKIISRFTHVIAVVDFLYEKRIQLGHDLDAVEEVIFQTAFNYVHAHFLTIQLIWDTQFNRDTKAMQKISKTINLLLYTQDFEMDLQNLEGDIQSDLQKLSDIELTILKYIEKHQQAPDTLFGLLNDVTTAIYEGRGIEYYGVNDIMYDIAIEYDLVNEQEDISVYNQFLSSKMNSSHENN